MEISSQWDISQYNKRVSAPWWTDSNLSVTFLHQFNIFIEFVSYTDPTPTLQLGIGS